eukprot:c10766_g1_i1.p1 GENE.c10766_g1_i1~~c10766_g1_i1.p1  ORF type:complete len:294 (+),score=76.73 c10766_g1_i1:44-925(+)
MEEYTEFLRASTTDPFLSKDILKQIESKQSRLNITPEQHAEALRQLGIPEETYTSMVMLARSEGLELAKFKIEDAESHLTETQAKIKEAKQQLEEWKTKNEPIRQEKAAMAATLAAKEASLDPKREEMKKIQVRLNVVKQRTIDREAETKRLYQDAQSADQDGIEGKKSKSKGLTKISALRKEILQRKREIDQKREMLKAGVFTHSPPSSDEIRFLEFHRLCLGLKVSVQNHESSNVMIDQLWQEVCANNIPREEWHAYVRSKLVPIGVEGYPHFRDEEKGLLDWLMNAIKGS